jgi:dTDP-4-dehydrorhamnose 3,5-epimerase
MKIEGVVTKVLKALEDERGFLMEMLRSDEPIFERFGQVYITCCRRGVAKGWHYHKEQADHFVCVAGRALVVLYDARPSSPTFGSVEEIVLVAPPSQDPPPLLLKIPPLVVHGFAAKGCEDRQRPHPRVSVRQSRRIPVSVECPRDPVSLAGRGHARGMRRMRNAECGMGNGRTVLSGNNLRNLRITSSVLFGLWFFPELSA